MVVWTAYADPGYVAPVGVQIGHRGGRWIELCVARPRPDAPRFHDAAHALRYLRERTDAGEVRRLRALLPGAELPAQRLDDAEVLRRIAEGLVARRLSLRFERDREHAWIEAPALEGPAARPSILRSPPDEPAEVLQRPRADLPEFVPPNDWDSQAQARTLILAAREGAPFCAVCQRTRSPIAAKPVTTASRPEAGESRAASDAPLPASVDAVAQARTLVQAARDGVPFCAVCVGR
jgi:hypothetical protein